MKIILVTISMLVVAAVFAPPALRAQEVPTKDVSTTTVADRTTLTDAELELMRKDVRSKRKQIIAANIQMTDAEAEKFWPVYDQYAADQKKAYDIHYGLLKEYAANEKT